MKVSIFEKGEIKFINSYETTLSEEGKKLCKEIENNIKVDNELLIKKASEYCEFILYKLDCLDPKLDERCTNYIDDVNNFYRYKAIFNEINNDRKERKRCLDMRNIKII